MNKIPWIAILVFVLIACIPGGLLLAWWLSAGWPIFISVIALIIFMAGG